MNLSRIPHFNRCFPERLREDRNFLGYARLISGRSSPGPSRDKPEKHHVVPREWLKFNVPGFFFETEDPLNVVYLSVEDKISAMQLVMLLSLDMNDSRTYGSIVASVARRYHLNRAELWRNPYMENVQALVKTRADEIRSKKKKYDDEYLRRCAEIMASDLDSDRAFQKVKDEMGFEKSKAALMAQISRRFGE